jgi:hypothetical protein
MRIAYIARRLIHSEDRKTQLHVTKDRLVLGDSHYKNVEKPPGTPGGTPSRRCTG